MKAGQEQEEEEEETSAVPWSRLEGRRVGTSPALDGSEGPLRAGKHDTIIILKLTSNILLAYRYAQETGGA